MARPVKMFHCVEGNMLREYQFHFIMALVAPSWEYSGRVFYAKKDCEYVPDGRKQYWQSFRIPVSFPSAAPENRRRFWPDSGQPPARARLPRQEEA